jgi:hypothetical protein
MPPATPPLFLFAYFLRLDAIAFRYIIFATPPICSFAENSVQGKEHTQSLLTYFRSTGFRLRKLNGEQQGKYTFMHVPPEAVNGPRGNTTRARREDAVRMREGVRKGSANLPLFQRQAERAEYQPQEGRVAFNSRSSRGRKKGRACGV